MIMIARVARGRVESGDTAVVTVGPLAGYETALRLHLASAGYSAGYVCATVAAMARLSEWMDASGVTVEDLTPQSVAGFLDARRQRVSGVIARRGVSAVLAFLREVGAMPKAPPVVVTPVESLLAAYRLWLVAERGFTADTVRFYAGRARRFLTQLDEPITMSLAGLDATTVTAIMVRHSVASANIGSAKAFVTVVRSLLRFLLVQGLVSSSLTGAVPAVAGWRLSALPKGLDAGQPEALLAAHDTTTAIGLRDQAILTVLARLGLRGAEVAALGLADVHWRDGEITVRGKGSRVERLPLPTEVGQAIAAYVMEGRPSCSCRTVFVTVRAPYRPLTPGAIRQIMGRACRRAGLPRLGAHRLRHTLATGLLRAGSSLAEVGQVLRHRNQMSTAIYAKVDHSSLGALARPWPGGADQMLSRLSAAIDARVDQHSLRALARAWPGGAR
jgi:site-specific recombinase XerD